MNRILLSAAGAPLNTSFEGSFTDTGQDFFGYSLLDIQRGFYTQPNNGGPRREIYALFDENHEIVEVMQCPAEGEVKTPHCNLYFKTEYFHINLGSIRRNEMHRITEIRNVVDHVLECRTE